MERQVGASLVERTVRGSRLTDAGVLVVDRPRELVESASSLEAGLASLRHREQRRLVIAASKTVAEPRSGTEALAAPQEQRVHEGLREVAGQSALLHVELLGEQPRRPHTLRRASK